MPSSCCGSDQSTCYVSDISSASTSQASSSHASGSPYLSDSRDVWDSIDVWDSARAPRGWAMRHGHSKRLAKPKTGKAGIWAEIQGQGQEVHRGRSVFKRSVNFEGKFGRRYFDWIEPKHKQQVQPRREISDANFAFYWEGEDWIYDQEDDESQFYKRDADIVDIAKERPRVRNTLSPLDSFCCKLLRLNAVVETDSLNSKEPFAKFQQTFLMKHGDAICENLQGCFCGAIELRHLCHPKFSIASWKLVLHCRA